MEANWARCELHQGQFSNEYALVIEAHNGKQFSLFVEKDEVKLESEPTVDNPGSGWVAVLVLKREEAFSLIKLPRSTIENGQCITIRSSSLRNANNTVSRNYIHDPLEYQAL